MKKFQKVLIAGLLVAGMVLLAGCGGQQDENAGGEEADNVLVVGTNAEFAPFEYISEEDGETIVGFDIDLINAIAADQGFTVELQNLEFDGLVMAVQNGTLDAAIAGMTVNESRLEQVDFTETYYDGGLNIAVPADNTDINSEEDLAGKVVASQQGTTGADKCMELKEAGLVADVKLLKDINVCMMDMANGSCDAVIMDVPVNNRYAESHPDEVRIAAEIVVPEEEQEKYAIAVQKGNTELLDKLNTGLANVMADGTYDAIYDKYFGGEPEAESETAE